jgi:hypothetical protein
VALGDFVWSISGAQGMVQVEGAGKTYFPAQNGARKISGANHKTKQHGSNLSFELLLVPQKKVPLPTHLNYTQQTPKIMAFTPRGGRGAPRGGGGARGGFRGGSGGGRGGRGGSFGGRGGFGEFLVYTVSTLELFAMRRDLFLYSLNVILIHKR